MWGVLRDIIKALVFMPIAALIILTAALLARYFGRSERKRLVWGSDPIGNNRYWSRAMKEAGFPSETFTVGYYAKISTRQDWDRILDEEFGRLPHQIKLVLAFATALFRYDVFVMGFSGFFVGGTGLWRLQAHAFRIARKKTVLIPFGADYFSYRDIRSTALLHGLLMSYPEFARKQGAIAARVAYWTRHADVMIPGMMGPDGGGRWDVLAPSSLSVDLDQWTPKRRADTADGASATVSIAHAPNHRGFKGSEFVIEAVEELRQEGLKVELNLIEGKQNSELRRILAEDTDILVEQLIATGHGLNAVEGMASGLCVVANLEDQQYTRLFRRWSHLDECPIVSAEPETIKNVLRRLITDPQLRKELGRANRAYAEKYHGLKASEFLFTEVIAYLDGERDSLINLYHPLLGPRAKTAPKITHPLVNNRLPDTEC